MRWSFNTRVCIYSSKKQFWLWKQAGRPRESDNIFFVKMKVAKKNLISAQRQQEACLRKNRYDVDSSLDDFNT
jgi:hypothetical protein